MLLSLAQKTQYHVVIHADRLLRQQVTFKDALNKWLRGRSAALRGVRFLAYPVDMS